MTKKLFFSWDYVPWVFSWIEGGKTINVHNKDDLKTDIDSISFDHEEKETRDTRAISVIIQYLDDLRHKVDRDDIKTESEE